jgi:hypothetical protein
MRRTLWVIVAGAAVAAVWVWGPSLLVQRELASLLQTSLRATRGVSVHASASALGLLRGRVDRVEMTAAGVQLGDLVAERLTATLSSIRFSRVGGRVELAGVGGGEAALTITQADLERLLRLRGVQRPAVTIDESGVRATGEIAAGPLTAEARLRGQFYAVDRTDLYFRVDAFDMGGMEIPSPLMTAILGVSARPIVSLRGLPVPMVVERITSGPREVVVAARIEATR